MSSPIDVLVLGELVVDLVATRQGPLAEVPGFTRAPGGAPAAVAAGVARLGRHAAVAGLVGDDPFGRYLIAALAGYGVDTRYIGLHPRGRTPVAFVSHDPNAPEAAEPEPAEGDGSRPAPQLLIYHEGGADRLWSPSWVPVEAIRQAGIVVGSGVSLAGSLPRAALHAAFAQAATVGATVAFDVNWRPALWQYPERARDLYHAILPQVDILMLNIQELILLTGGVASSEEARLEAILRAWIARLVEGRSRPLLVALTRGPAGCSYGLWRPGGAGLDLVHLPACDIAVKDRSGAGGAFLAGLLVALLDHLAPVSPLSPSLSVEGNTPSPAPPRLDLGRLEVPAMAEIFAWANASGALATTRRGALAALPGRSTVLRLIKGRRSG